MFFLLPPLGCRVVLFGVLSPVDIRCQNTLPLPHIPGSCTFYPQQDILGYFVCLWLRILACWLFILFLLYTVVFQDIVLFVIRPFLPYTLCLGRVSLLLLWLSGLVSAFPTRLSAFSFSLDMFLSLQSLSVMTLLLLGRFYVGCLRC